MEGRNLSCPVWGGRRGNSVLNALRFRQFEQLHVGDATVWQWEGHLALAAVQLRAHDACKPYRHVTVNCNECFEGGEVQLQEEAKFGWVAREGL